MQDSNTKGPVVEATTYTIWPTGYSHTDQNAHEAHHFTLTVEYRSPGRYAVVRFRKCLSNDGLNWEYESLPSGREEQFLENYRMPLDRALELARQHVDQITVNGRTWAEWQAVLSTR